MPAMTTRIGALAGCLALFVLVSCGPSTPPQVSCKTPFKACGNACVTLDDDPLNCGACGTACGDGKSCVKGACYANDCAGTDCSASQVCPADRCTDKSCLGVACPSDQGCLNGACVQTACATHSCTVGLLCVNGSCDDVACYGVVCPGGGICKLGACVSSSCTDGVIGADESDIDCGGACPDCGLGKTCNAATDCASASCASGKCTTAATCSNAVKDGLESDVDCGGGCRPCPDGKACGVKTDCFSAECTSGRCTSSAQCADGIKNNTETDIDCGGSCPTKCSAGGGCLGNPDCASNACASNVCAQAPTCTDGVKNGLETDIDCGGPSCLRKCNDAGGCGKGTDCVSGTCSAGGMCSTPSCTDGVKNGTEADVDCGRNCPLKCAGGSHCGAALDCADGICNTMTCQQPTCTDTVANGAESDVDCGGSCPDKCPLDKKCKGNGDCASNQCNNGLCISASQCMDLVKNGTETDIDCGGGCPAKCGGGKSCSINGDCAGGACTSSICAQPATCSDTVKNGLETSIDCGGPVCIARCADSGGCAVNGDCQSGRCGSTMTCAAPSCTDGAKNSTEADVDCGGPCTTKCTTNKHCNAPTDCIDKVCTNSVCQPPVCTDMVGNGTESDIDCGGSCPKKCAYQQRCLAGTDCKSGFCVAGRCSADPSCSDGLQNQDEVGVDCGGAICPACGLGSTCNVTTDCLSLFCGGTPTKKCDTGFVTPGPSQASSGYYRLQAAKLNADAFFDLLSPVNNRSDIVIATGNVNGTFSAFTALGLGTSMLDFVAIDFTGDGKTDIVGVNSSDVLLVKGNGNGTFQSPVATAFDPAHSSGSVALGTGDLNGDGKPDLVLATTGTYRAFYALLGDGAGGFTTTTNLVLTGSVGFTRVAVADISGDGKLDVLVGTTGGTMLELIGDGAGHLVNTPTPLSVSGGGGIGDITTGDLNGDGKVDIAATCSANGVCVLFGTGVGGFATSVLISLPTQPNSVTIGDINSDGKNDLELSTCGGMYFRIGDGTGGFSNSGPVSFASNGCFAHLMMDFNLDGLPDIAGETGSNFSVLYRQ